MAQFLMVIYIVLRPIFVQKMAYKKYNITKIFSLFLLYRFIRRFVTIPRRTSVLFVLELELG